MDYCAKKKIVPDKQAQFVEKNNLFGKKVNKCPVLQSQFEEKLTFWEFLV